MVGEHIKRFFLRSLARRQLRYLHEISQAVQEDLLSAPREHVRAVLLQLAHEYDLGLADPRPSEHAAASASAPAATGKGSNSGTLDVLRRLRIPAENLSFLGLVQTGHVVEVCMLFVRVLEMSVLVCMMYVRVCMCVCACVSVCACACACVQSWGQLPRSARDRIQYFVSSEIAALHRPATVSLSRPARASHGDASPPVHAAPEPETETEPELAASRGSAASSHDATATATATAADSGGSPTRRDSPHAGLGTDESITSTMEAFVQWSRANPGRYFRGDKTIHEKLLLLGMWSGKVAVIKRSAIEEKTVVRYIPVCYRECGWVDGWMYESISICRFLGCTCCGVRVSLCACMCVYEH